MRFVEALLEVPERATDLDIRSYDVLNLVCAAAHTTEFPKDVSLDEVDSTVLQMVALDEEGRKVTRIAAKMKSLPTVRSTGPLFI